MIESNQWFVHQDISCVIILLAYHNQSYATEKLIAITSMMKLIVMEQKIASIKSAISFPINEQWYGIFENF